MNCKRILKFYFNADILNSAMDGLILKRALNFDGGCESGAESILDVIEKKCAAGELYGYIDKIMDGLDGRDRATLKFYALRRDGCAGYPDGVRREIKRAVCKFLRRARRLYGFKDGIKVVSDFYCLICRGERRRE